MNIEATSVSPFKHSIALHEQLLSFSEKAGATQQLSDGLLTARIVGEFSAGKTRLLRELFADLIPEALFPISSLERQTRLPLELTYGETPVLSLIERAEDYMEAQLIKELDHFPDRAEATEWDAMKHRLRLTIKEPRFILTEGDGYSDDKTPKRLFLIDTPGWNSGDDELAELDAESLMKGHHNLGLVYVSQSQRIDGSTNADHLKDFMSVLADADFLDRANLLFVITYCPTENAERMKQKAKALVYSIWKELGRDDDELDLTLFAVDFPSLSATELAQFKTKFWEALQAPLNLPAQTQPTDAWTNTLRNWPTEWDVRPALQESANLMLRAETLIAKARKNEEFIAGMNKHRLMGLDDRTKKERILDRWLQQLGVSKPDLNNWNFPQLPVESPLYAWWQNYWQPNLKNCIQPVIDFFNKAQTCINRLTPEQIDQLQPHLDKELSNDYNEALLKLNSSFACLLKTANNLVGVQEPEKMLSTLFTLSILQARYEDYYEQHSNQLNGAGI